MFPSLSVCPSLFSLSVTMCTKVTQQRVVASLVCVRAKWKSLQFQLPQSMAVSNNETQADDLVEPLTKTGSIKISFLYGLFFTSSVSLSWRGVDCDWGLQQTSGCWNLPKLTSFFLICCVQMNNDIYTLPVIVFMQCMSVCAQSIMLTK